MEAGIEPTNLKQHNQQRSAWLKWHIKPESHQFWKVKTAFCLNNKNWISPLQKIAQKFNKLDLSKMEKIGSYARDPSTSLPRVIIPDYKENAIRLAKQYKKVAAFMDSSARNNLVETGIYWQGIQWRSTTNTISAMSTLTNFLGELAVIEAVVKQIWNVVTYKSLKNTELRVFSDS